MKWSWKIGTFLGIGVYVHWTFLLLIVWIAGIHLAESRSIPLALEGVGFILAVFGCVVLHEYGHALMARRFGIQTRDITLLPIGGVARLERMPEDPKQEFLVAIAGPAVNVAISAILAIVLVIFPDPDAGSKLLQVGGHFFAKLLAVNLVLVVFNLLPAFPMDGGRVLRALLASRMDYPRATRIAANVGQFVAILFGIVGAFSNWFLVFIAIFVYLGAEEEARSVEIQHTFRSIPVEAAMMTAFKALDDTDPIGRAVNELLAGSQHDFPVLRSGRLVGVLTRSGLLRALSEKGVETTVVEAMDMDDSSIPHTETLERAFRRMRELGREMLPVLKEGRVIGMLSMENISEWAMVNAAIHANRQESRS